ncbi:MAG: tetratricopeptide repeat protein [Polyangiaceae bacterium]
MRRDELGDPGGAAELLRQAAEVEPQDAELAVELAQCLGAAGMHDQAVQTISEQLGDDDDALDASRAPLLLVRAELRTAAGHDAAAIDDLERAFGLQPDAAAEALESALTTAIDGAVAVGDRESERRYTLRAVDVMSSRGKRAEAAMLLRGWTSRHEEDVEALRRLRDMDTAEGAWRAVAETCLRLIHLEQGVAQVDAALGLSHAHQELGEPEGAREGLEHVRDLQPDSPQVRAELRKIYEQLGDQQELAKLLVGDAQLEEDPATKAEMLQRAGHIFVDLGDAVSAIPPLREAHQLVPQPSTVVPLADAYILAGWFDDAGDLLSRAIEAGRGRRSPEICVYYHRKAKVAEAQGDRARQLELLLEAHQSNKKNGLVAADLADLAESLEQWDLAARTLRTITLIDTQCPISRAEAFLRQGRIAHVQGDNKNAKMWARRAKREDPEWDAIDHFLIELGDRPSAPPGRG